MNCHCLAVFKVNIHLVTHINFLYPPLGALNVLCTLNLAYSSHDTQIKKQGARMTWIVDLLRCFLFFFMKMTDLMDTMPLWSRTTQQTPWNTERKAREWLIYKTHQWLLTTCTVTWKMILCVRMCVYVVCRSDWYC